MTEKPEDPDLDDTQEIEMGEQLPLPIPVPVLNPDMLP